MNYDEFVKEVQKVLPRHVPRRSWCKSRKPVRRALNLLLSDWHIGSHLLKTEVPLPYGPKEETARIGYVVRETVEYKTQYRDNTELHVHLLGDLPNGVLHDPREGLEYTTQFGMTVNYLIQVLTHFGQEFPRVLVHFTPGNHGRIISRHKDRAVFQKWDSFESMVYLAVKMAVQCDNVIFDELVRTPYYIVNLFGKKGIFAHGDGGFGSGVPCKRLDLKSMSAMAAQWTMARHVGGPFDWFAVGHFHISSQTVLSNGATMMVNSSLIPVTPFGLHINAPDVACSQFLVESVPGYIVGDTRRLSVDNAERSTKNRGIIEPCTI